MSEDMRVRGAWIEGAESVRSQIEREDVAAAVKELRARADDQGEDLVQRAIAEYAWTALEGPNATAPGVDEHGWPIGLMIPANTSYTERYDGELYVVLENVNGPLAVLRAEDGGSLSVLDEDEWPAEVVAQES
jgi:hypothetical protein